MKYLIKVKKTAESFIEVEARSRREATAQALKEAAHGSVRWVRTHHKPIIIETRRNRRTTGHE